MRALIEEWHFTRPRSLNQDFINDVRYELLRPHLSARTKSLLDDPTIVVEDNGDPDDTGPTSPGSRRRGSSFWRSHAALLNYRGSFPERRLSTRTTNFSTGRPAANVRFCRESRYGRRAVR